MNNMRLRDEDNLEQFADIVKRAYIEAKERSQIPSRLICAVDKLVVQPAVVQGPGFRPIEVHRAWRRRVVRKYSRATRRTLFDWDIDWESVYNWVLENIVPILKLLLMVVPFII